jgi:hypothetical protein
MVSGGQFWDNAPVVAVHGDLGVQSLSKDALMGWGVVFPGGGVINSYPGLITRSFYA